MSTVNYLKHGSPKRLDYLRSQYFPGKELKLLEFVDEDGVYEVLCTLANKWFFENSDFRPSQFDRIARGNYILWISDKSDDAIEAMKTASHCSIDNVGAPEPTEEDPYAPQELYVLNRADSNPPTNVEPVWQVHCDHEFV